MEGREGKGERERGIKHYVNLSQTFCMHVYDYDPDAGM